MIWLGLFASWAAIGWFLFCNNRTYWQRRQMRDEVWRRSQSDQSSIWSEFERVDYDSHLWALMCRRDPWMLYGPIVRALAQGVV